MHISFAGAVLLIAGCTAIGFYLARKEGFRVEELQEFKKALMILASEIEHMRSPLAVASASIAKRVKRPVSGIFRHFSQALEDQKPQTHFADEDWDIIEGFGKTLGYLDKQMQQSAIAYAAQYIDDKVASLLTQADKNKRMYRSLGLIGGLLLAVVLW